MNFKIAFNIFKFRFKVNFAFRNLKNRFWIQRNLATSEIWWFESMKSVDWWRMTKPLRRMLKCLTKIIPDSDVSRRFQKTLGMIVRFVLFLKFIFNLTRIRLQFLFRLPIDDFVVYRQIIGEFLIYKFSNIKHSYIFMTKY